MPPLPDERSLRMTFEILAAEAGGRLDEELHAFQGGRLVVEEAFARGERFRRATFLFPLPDGDTRERVIYFAEDGDRLRMIGFHRILRRAGSPHGETIVFNPGPENPMQGRGVSVPHDTYTYLGLCAALGGLAAEPAPSRVHLWTGEEEPLAVEIVPEGREELSVLGTRMPGLRLRVRPSGRPGAEATYWFAESPPHSFLQYRGPGDFLLAGEEAPAVVLRATSSSEQVRRMLEPFEAGPR